MRTYIWYFDLTQKPLSIKGLSIDELALRRSKVDEVPPRGFKWNTIEKIILRWKGVFEGNSVLTVIKN